MADGDIMGGRPTVLWALALEGLDEVQRAELGGLISTGRVNRETITRVRQLYQASGVFDKAARLVDKYQERAEAVADEVEPDELRRLLYYLVDTVLERPQAETPEVAVTTLALAKV
jgi:geranylgeranyl pyrophosphate synthase